MTRVYIPINDNAYIKIRIVNQIKQFWFNKCIYIEIKMNNKVKQLQFKWEHNTKRIIDIMLDVTNLWQYSL